MATLLSFTLENYRSIQDRLEIKFPVNKPLVLLGENNSGKSNIVKGLNLILGGFWPGSHDPEDHEFFGRDRNRRIRLRAQFSEQQPFGGRYTNIQWEFDPANREPSFRAHDDRTGQYREYINNNDRDSCVCVVLEAERNLGYQLGYSSKFTLLSKLMHRFHKALAQRAETKTELEQLFVQIKNKFAEIPEFAEFTGTLRDQLGDLIGSMTHKLDVNFEAYNPTNFFHALRLQANEGADARTLEEMGTGESQILAISFAYAFAQAFHGGIVLTIEEPESHLHPLAQQWLAQRLHSLSAGGLQIVLTTHSPHFIDVMSLDGLVLVRKDADGTSATQLSAEELAESCVQQGAPAGRVSEQTILPFYRSAATPEILEGFFAKAVVLVEGQSEKLAVPIYLKRSDLNHTKEGIAIIPVLGKGSLAKWRRLFVAYGIPVYIVFDNDDSEDGDGVKRTDALKAVGIEGHRSEELIAATDIIIEDEFCIFGRDFEAALEQIFPNYAGIRAQAIATGNEGKPLIARYVAENLPVGSEEGWTTLRNLAQKLRDLVRTD